MRSKATQATLAETAEQSEKQRSSARSMISRLDAVSPLSLLGQGFPSDLNKPLDGRTTTIEGQDFLANLVTPSSQSGQIPAIKEGSEMMYARVVELQLSSPKPQNTQGLQTLYMGESWLLTYVVQKVSPTDTESSASPSSALQVPLPASLGDKSENLGYDTRLDLEDIEVLKLRGAFTLLQRDVSDQLIQTFFDVVYPAFPIFDREEFMQLYEKNQLPLLLLQTIYLLASTLCDEDVIKKAGFENRSTARKTFLKRARALYDVDYETNKVTLIQAVFLMSFLWNGSMDDKDMWHWLGVAISLAQGKGMHRSTANSNLRPQDRRLWKRIWWSLYVRDRHCAINIGRPMRIRDDDCDVEQLDVSDFQDYLADGPSLYGKRSMTHVLYVIAMSKLSVIFGNVVLTKFNMSKSRSTFSRADLNDHLSKWRQQLPPELRDGDEVDENGFWARMLELNYNHHLILLHRPEQGNAAENETSVETIAFMAANKITRVVDDFLASGVLRQAQLQICPSIFAALSMYVLIVHRSDKLQRKLAEHKARLLLLGCAEIAKTWPACGWIQRLFETIFKNLEEKSSPNAPGSSQVTSRQPATGVEAQIPSHPGRRAVGKVPNNDGLAQYHNSIQSAKGGYQGETMAAFQPDIPFYPSLVNMGDAFGPEHLDEFSQDFGAENQDFPNLMEFNFSDW